MDIWFYHLTREPLERALPILLERSLDRGWRAVVQARDEERLSFLDDALWTWSDASFIAHGMARDGDAAVHPVYLTTGLDAPNGPRVRFFVDGAEIAPAIAAPDAPKYDRCVVMFDGTNEPALAAARAQWRVLKELGHTLSYWRQGEAGGWEKMSG
jgi:DNA polymerase-3 subunit chi